VSVLEQLRMIEKKIAALNENSFVDLASLQREGGRLFHSILINEHSVNLKT
jgi:hypothetical protein